jgi:nucleotide-binding universal stress UspA family protein
LRGDGIETTALTIRGPTAATILSEATRLGVELIVMATHGRGAVFDLLVGSVSHAVLRETHVPVLLVPARD